MANRLERWVAPAVATAQAGVALAILKWGLTGPVPVHFAWSGEVDRYGGRAETAGMAFGMAVLSFLGPLAIRALSRRRTDETGDFSEAILMLLGVTSLICALAACLAFGLIEPESGPLGLMSAVCAMFAVIGAYLGKVGPNALIGVRTPWTFSSRLAWDKSNRLAGRLFFWTGLVGFLIAPFAPQPMGAQAFTVLILAIAGLAVFESWRVWRSDPDRTGAL